MYRRRRSATLDDSLHGVGRDLGSHPVRAADGAITQNGSGKIHRDSRCSAAQPQGHLAAHPARPAHRGHRPVRLGQEQPGFRHAVRRRPATLCRIAVDLRPAVSRANAKTGRGPHRGPAADGGHRAALRQQQPALHRRHHHRDLRLPAHAVRSRGHAALLEVSPPHRAALASTTSKTSRCASRATG